MEPQVYLGMGPEGSPCEFVSKDDYKAAVKPFANEPPLTDKQMCELSLMFNHYASLHLTTEMESTINEWLKWNIERIRLAEKMRKEVK